MSTGARVPRYPYDLAVGGVQVGRPPRGGFTQWGPFAEQANYLLGRGGVLIPWCTTKLALAASGSYTLRFRVIPRYQATHRRWRFAVLGGGGAASGVFTDPSGGSRTFTIGGSEIHTFEHIEAISSRTASETELAPTFTLASGSTSCTLETMNCWEHPRPELALNTNDLGVAVRTLDPGTEVLAGTDGYSVGAVGEAVEAARSVARRNGLYHFAADTAQALSTTSASCTRVLTLAADPILQDRQLYVGQTTSSVLVRVRARAGTTTAGNIRFTMTSGASLVLAITSGMAATWLTGTLAVDTDNFGDDVRGRRRTPGDKCVIEWQRTSGANSIFIESISIIGAGS